MVVRGTGEAGPRAWATVSSTQRERRPSCVRSKQGYSDILQDAGVAKFDDLLAQSENEGGHGRDIGAHTPSNFPPPPPGLRGSASFLHETRDHRRLRDLFELRPSQHPLGAALTEQIFGGLEAVSRSTTRQSASCLPSVRRQRQVKGAVSPSPSFTFAATAHAALWAGLTPLFCDIDSEPGTRAPPLKTECCTPMPARLPAVPYACFGNGLDLDRYARLAQEEGIGVVVDAAASLGSLDGAGHGFAPASRMQSSTQCTRPRPSPLPRRASSIAAIRSASAACEPWEFWLRASARGDGQASIRSLVRSERCSASRSLRGSRGGLKPRRTGGRLP